MLRAAGRNRVHSRKWQRPGCLGPREGDRGLRPSKASQAFRGSLFIVPRALGSSGGGLTGGTKVGVGKPERRLLQFS